MRADALMCSTATPRLQLGMSLEEGGDVGQKNCHLG